MLKAALRSIALAAVTTAMITAPADAAAPAKPAAKPAAAKPAAPHPKIPNFDARNPSSIVALFSEMNAEAKVANQGNGQVGLTITTQGGAFGAQMIGCNAQNVACHAIALFTVFEKKGVTLAQINDFNRSQLACRGILTPDGRPSVMYATLVNARMPEEETRVHMGAWQGCLIAFGEFTRDPEAFLSKPHT